jgi:peptidoglycan/LPS O-acetylase OafA/YrhL
LRILYQVKKSTAGISLAGVMVLGMLIRAAFTYKQIEHLDIWVLPITHFEAIFGGLIIGLGILDKYLKKIREVILLSGGVLALYLVTRLPNIENIQWGLMLTYPLLGIGVTLILAAVIQGKLWLLSTIFKNKFLGYLGKISFGLYVYHVASIWLASKLTISLISPDRLLLYPSTVLLLALIITVAISMLSYQFLERPFMQLKERFTFIKSRPV